MTIIFYLISAFTLLDPLFFAGAASWSEGGRGLFALAFILAIAIDAAILLLYFKDEH